MEGILFRVVSCENSRDANNERGIYGPSERRQKVHRNRHVRPALPAPCGPGYHLRNAVGDLNSRGARRG